eukprot:GHVU01187811.1.p1 GENE.GHVU01187811.1~~GHVU01187811.1.p1  ORF type:complete len:255 (+),score=17.09 GHVU01187811.1:490-1254(+)
MNIGLDVLDLNKIREALKHLVLGGRKGWKQNMALMAEGMAEILRHGPTRYSDASTVDLQPIKHYFMSADEAVAFVAYARTRNDFTFVFNEIIRSYFLTITGPEGDVDPDVLATYGITESAYTRFEPTLKKAALELYIPDPGVVEHFVISFHVFTAAINVATQLFAAARDASDELRSSGEKRGREVTTHSILKDRPAYGLTWWLTDDWTGVGCDLSCLSWLYRFLTAHIKVTPHLYSRKRELFSACILFTWLSVK